MSISILSYILAGVIILLLGWIWYLEHRLKKFFAGTKGQNLEQVLLEIGRNLKETKENHTKLHAHLTESDVRLDKSIRTIKMLRFNPFEDSGSNQSFAMALLNDEGDGVVISSLYARDRMSIFAKPIEKGASEFELSVEEAEVLKQAL